MKNCLDFLKSFILYIAEEEVIVSKSTSACKDIDLTLFGLVIFFSDATISLCTIADLFQLGMHPMFSWLKGKNNTKEAPCTYRLHLHIKPTAQSAWRN
jgi:hypothetical protein